ncbi:MAG: GNAT family N-acetyltransferase, partial [Oscillospiraceae bacterium]|nr:GNAT family N-acetyltransferase [Oscillospiraceae bacterium]
NACIAHPEAGDEYLTGDSERFHARMGYETVAHFHRCGFKFGRWYDMVWMEKMIGDHTPTPAPVKSFSHL